MQINPYGSDKASLAVGLVNADPDITPEAMGLLLASHKTRWPVVDAAQTADLLAWAAKLRLAFEARDLDERIDVVNRLLGEAAIRPTIARHEGEMTPHLHYSLETDDIVRRAQARTATALAHVICASGGGRLGCCDREGCTVVFVDTSRNGRRRFCSTQCSNRVYVADHRARASLSRGGRGG